MRKWTDISHVIDTAIKWDKEECYIWPYKSKNWKGYAEHWRFGRMSRYICSIMFGPPPTAKHQAAHSCGKGRQGCIAGNHLRWATATENMADRVEHGTNISHRGEQQWQAKLTADKVLEIRRLKGKYSNAAIARIYGVARTTINNIYAGGAWSWLKDPEEECDAWLLWESTRPKMPGLFA